MPAGKREDTTRKRVDELITRYEFNPDLRDIYVEGEWDRRIVTWVLRQSGVKGVTAYDIDSVHIDADCLMKHGLPAGKKGRVVALALELQGRIADPKQVTCIADRDYDHLLEAEYSSPLLLKTDYCTQEAYFLNESVIGKFLDIVVGGCPVNPRQLLDNVLPCLQHFHLLRAANLSLKWGMEWLSPEKCCEVKNNTIVVDAGTFVERYLNKNSKLGQKAEFIARCDLLKKRLTADPLQHISKDDVFCLLAELLPKFCKDKSRHQAEYIARSLAGCAEFATIVAYPLYQSLLTKVRNSV